MLEHALSINAQEQYQKIIAFMVPNLDKKDRQEIIENYLRLIDGEEQENRKVNDDIIKTDRENLRNFIQKYNGVQIKQENNK